MTVQILPDPPILTMVHVYEMTPDTQQSVYDGLIEGLRLYGTRMAGHISSSIHRSIDGLRVTSYSQWDREKSRALFEDPAALAESLEWFRPLTAGAGGQDSHLYDGIFVYEPATGA